MAKKKARRISVNNLSDLDYWCEELRCRKEDLVEAVSRVGNSYQTVRDYLEMNHKTGAAK